MKLFAPTGDLADLCVVSKDTWPGVGVSFSRENYNEVVKRQEVNRPGVYVLIGGSEDEVIIYVGEGDPVKDRLNRHFKEKAFWKWAVFFVGNSRLHKAHIQRLEARLCQLAKNSKRCKLENDNKPQPPTLAEAEVAFVENFLREAVSIFALLGVRVFDESEMDGKFDKPDETDKVAPGKVSGARRLPLPQARILQALLPVAGKKPSLSPTELTRRIEVSLISGTIPVAMGGRSDSPQHKGLLAAGLVTKVKGKGNRNAYQITTEGIRAIERYLKEHGELPKPRDKAASVNIRYKEQVQPPITPDAIRALAPKPRAVQ